MTHCHRLIFAAVCVLASPLLALQPKLANAQLPRERADPGAAVYDMFWAPTLVSTSTATVPERASLDFTIMHSFGIATDGISELFGLDGVANIRFGLDYSVSDRLSIGVGRSRFEKAYDGRFKLSLIRQTRDGRVPIAISVQSGAAIETAATDVPVDFGTIDRLSYMASVMFARKMSNRTSLQVAPLWGHMNTVVLDRDTLGRALDRNNDQVAVVGIVHIKVNDWLALAAEHVAIVSGRNAGTSHPLSLSVELNSGGHVFQVFATSTQWFTPQHMIAATSGEFLAGDFRLGFNVHRVFAIGHN